MRLVLFTVENKQFQCEKGFPDCFGPLGLRPQRSALKLILAADLNKQRWQLNVDDQVIPGGRLSATAPLTLDEFELAELGVPPEAKVFAWCYPASAELRERFSGEGDKDFFERGGFAYFDEGGSCLQVLALCEEIDGCKDLKLGQPRELDPVIIQKWQDTDRFSPVTLPVLKAGCAKQYTWTLPGEVFDSPHGGFAYTVDANNRPFSILDALFSLWCCKSSDRKGVPSSKYELAVREIDLKTITRALDAKLPRLPKLCILGGRKFFDSTSDLLVRELATAFSKELRGKAVVVTGGLEGVQEVFVTTLGLPEQVFNIVPRGETSNFSIGQQIQSGANMKERIAVYGQIGDVYITIEGGPGVSAEANAAFDRGAVVIPMMWTGGASSGKFEFPAGALAKPEYFSKEEWKQLRERTKEDPSELAKSTAKIVIQAMRKLVEKGFPTFLDAN